MTWPKYVLLAWYAFGALYAVATIGKQRKPMDPLAAAIYLVLTAGLAYLVVIA